MLRGIVGGWRPNAHRANGDDDAVAVVGTLLKPIQVIDAVSDRDLGDRARDRQDWFEASRHYRVHLNQEPEDGAIWVQFGHALKESNDYAGAEAAYRAAMSLMPGDADAALQFGHLLKLAGRAQDAINAYTKALSLDPSTAAYDELVGLGQQAHADQTLRMAERPGAMIESARLETVSPGATAPKMYFQIMDLLNFMRAHKTPSGIQRVQLGIISHALATSASRSGPQVEFVFNHSNDLRIWQVSRSSLGAMVDYLSSVRVDHAVLRSLIDAVCDNVTLVQPGPGSSFIILGAFWGTPGNTPLMASLRAQGATLGCYIYDLIPITHPEYCVHDLTVSFTQSLCEALCLLDFVVTISDYTAQEVRRFITSHGFPDIPVESVPLAHSLTGSRAVQGDAPPGWTGPIAWLQGRDYVLYVCTIEARKNHRYLYDVWKTLMRQGVPVPDLVFVGRRGWHVDEFLAQLEASNYLDGTIHIVHDLSDSELETLYRGCRFTVFPSIVEGWGLPVGESLTYGKLCVASDTSSMPEVGGSLVEYIDPLNLRSGLETLQRLFREPERVAQWEDRIRREFLPRTWDDVSRDFLHAAARLHAAVPAGMGRRAVARLDPGEVFDISSMVRSGKMRPARDYAKLKRLIFDENWYSPENFGIWMRESSGSIGFNTGLTAGDNVILYLRVAGAPNAAGVTLIATSNAGAVEIEMQANQLAQFRLKAVAGEGGNVEASFHVHGDYDTKVHGDRVFCIGLVQVAFAPEQDGVARAELLEHFLLDLRSRSLDPVTAHQRTRYKVK